MTTLQARNLSLEEVHRLLGFEDRYNGSFEPWLAIDPLSETECQELQQIQTDIRAYVIHSRFSEGQIRLIAVAPLLRLAGFYQHPVQLKVEEGIDRIEIDNENTTISGRFDIVAIRKGDRPTETVDLWILAIETKEGLASLTAGLPQLLVYAYGSLETQNSVWGLLTNGIDYSFIRIFRDRTPVYEYVRNFNLLYDRDSVQLLQVLKAISQGQ